MCYATCIDVVDGEKVFIGCSEGAKSAYSYKNGVKSTIWEEIGGTMNFVPVPNKKNTYLATRKFLPVFNSQECEINLVTFNDDAWSVTPIMNIPYLHRFDVLEKNGKNYLVGGTLCESKKEQNDWSKPGSFIVGELSDDLTAKIELREIYKGITKNHGMFRETNLDIGDSYVISGQEGAFAFIIPNDPFKDEWKMEKLLNTEVSDVAFVDIDNDGVLELATIEGFHGSNCNIYKKTDGEYKLVKSYDIEFGHVLFGCKVCGVNTLILGYRRNKMELSLITCEDKEFVNKVIDSETGPSQISVLNEGDTTIILAANRQINELAVYELTR